MGHDYVVISIIICFLFAPCYHSFREPIDGGDNPLTNEKNATLSVPEPFRRAPGVQFTNGERNTISHYAMWHTSPGKYHGLRAEMSIWGSPNQRYSQETGAAIQIYCQHGGQYSLFEVGFHVSPSLYHNRDVRFFTFSTEDTKAAGCYNNLHCARFVPAEGAALVPGQAVSPPSVYGQADHYVRLSLNEDPDTGDWVVYRHDLDKPSFLGHFPKELCPTTSRIQALTGFVNYLNTTSGPPMGSGHFPDEDVKRSAYFKHVKMYDSKGHAWDPHTTRMIDLVDKEDCYKATGLLLDFKKGYTFYYGGPSGCVG